MPDTAVLLQCEHWGTASHELGDRQITCETCGEQTVVRCEPVTVLRYSILFEFHDEDGKLVRSAWRTTADMQAETEARQNVAAKQHAIEDGLVTREEMFPPPTEFHCTCVPGEGCDAEGDPGCRYCQIADSELPCPADNEYEQGTGPDSFDCPEQLESD